MRRLSPAHGRDGFYPRAILIPGVGFVLTIVGAAIYGSARGGTNLFSTGAPWPWVWACTLYGRSGFKPQPTGTWPYPVTAIIAIRLGALYFNYFTGNGEILQGVTIPVYDGPTISCLVFAALLGLSYGECVARRLPRFFLLGLSVLACVMVALCFRRTYWVSSRSARSFCLCSTSVAPPMDCLAPVRSSVWLQSCWVRGLHTAAKLQSHPKRLRVQRRQRQPRRRSSRRMGSGAPVTGTRNWSGHALSDVADPELEGRIGDGA